MPAFAGPTKGRGVLLKRGVAASEVLIAGVRVKGVSINGEPIDVTDDDSAGWAEKLDEPGEIQVTMSVSGVAINHTLLAEAMSNTDRVQSNVLEYPGGGKISGNFFLASYSENAEYKGLATFEAEFQSTGTITYTPGA